MILDDDIPEKLYEVTFKTYFKGIGIAENSLDSLLPARINETIPDVPIVPCCLRNDININVG